jgi:membrane-associated phospholipid phosphatase
LDSTQPSVIWFDLARPMLSFVTRLVVVTFTLGTASVSAGEGLPPAPNSALTVDPVLDGAITATALLGSAFLPLLPVDTNTRWQSQLLPFDDDLKGRFSTRDARISDYLVGTEVALPFALLGSQGLTTDTVKYALVYGETLSLSILLNGVVKYSVARPRPYVYSADADVLQYAMDQGKDSHLSFYSGHSSTAFATSVSSAILFAQRSQNNVARTAVWAAGLAMASATATLRTTAGKHFYSDVLVGSAVGTTIGWGIPRLHGARVKLSTSEWVAIVAAPILGIVVASLVSETQHEPAIASQ